MLLALLCPWAGWFAVTRWTSRLVLSVVITSEHPSEDIRTKAIRCQSLFQAGAPQPASVASKRARTTTVLVVGRRINLPPCTRAHELQLA
jgi:hypothetical protein